MSLESLQPTGDPDIDAYKCGETVFCICGPLIFEGVVIAHQGSDFKDGSYLVQCKGWKNQTVLKRKYLLKYTEENLQRQEEMNRRHISLHGDQGLGNCNLSVGQSLKDILVEDWEAITQRDKILQLRTWDNNIPSVLGILTEFTDHVMTTNPDALTKPSLFAPVIQTGLLTYFNSALPHRLLYPEERLQHVQVRSAVQTGSHVTADSFLEVSQVYGAIHLLRLLGQLPGLLQQTRIDLESMTVIQDYINELLSWLCIHRERFFGREGEMDGLYVEARSKYDG